MKTYGDLSFREIKEADIELLAPIMKRAFDEDTRIHLGREEGGPLGYDNGDFLRRYALCDDVTSYKILLDGQIIGAVMLWINKETQHNTLGNIFIDPCFENRGMGKKVWDFIESEFPETEVWDVETPIFSRRNHNFYVNKCGFHVVQIKKPKDLEDGSFILEKRMPKLRLRALLDQDLPLLKTWLSRPHVAKYYENPDDWLAEISGRDGEYSFIKHFIVESDGRPVGFCQYYDCFYGQGYEDWYEAPKPGELFSIDYLLSEPEYLGKSYGKKIVGLLTELIRGISGAKGVIEKPEADNRPSQGVLEANRYQKQGDLYRMDFQ